MDQWIKGKEVIYLNTPMGQRPGEFLIKFGSKMWVLGGSWGSKNRSWERSWGVLGGSGRSWGVLGCLGGPGALQIKKNRSWEGSWEVLGGS